MLDTEQHLEELQQLNELRLKNTELKKELEREQTLHKMLYKDWQKLTAEMSAQKHQMYEDSRPKNLFYKYAFYVLLAGLVAGAYYFYQQTGNIKAASSPVASDTIDAARSTAARTAATEPNPVPAKDSVSTKQNKPINNQVVTHQPAPSQPILQHEEKHPVAQDSTKTIQPIIRKHAAETPLTDDARDSISALGFSAYFNHHRNPFKRSSEKYKVWAEGWNQGKAEGKKLEEKIRL